MSTHQTDSQSKKSLKQDLFEHPDFYSLDDLQKNKN